MTKVQSILVLIVAGFLSAGIARGQDQLRAQVASAATANALKTLGADIRAARISPTLTVALFLDKTGADDIFDETIREAQQIGAPRWVDDQTCQVRLELNGARVARSLVAIAATRPRLSPLQPAVMTEMLSDWKQRTFAATGTSVAASKVSGIRPARMSERWNAISDDARGEALTAAGQDAAQRVMDDIRPIRMSDGQTVGDLLSREPVQKAVRTWVASQPVTSVQFRDDLQVELTVSTPPDLLLQTVVDSARTIPGTTLPADNKSIEELQREFNRRISGAIGRASVTQQTETTRPVSRRIELPAQTPAWVGSLLDAEGTSPAASTALRTKTAAENKATDVLRARVNSLPLSNSITLEDAAKFDPRIADAINRTLLRSRVYKVDYAASGSISVRMTIDSRELWGEIRQAVGQ